MIDLSEAMRNAMKLAPTRLTKSAALAAITVLAVLTAPAAVAQAEGQKTFASSKEAVDAFIRATRDGHSEQMQAILGPGSEQIISSGDDVADKKARDWFVANYDASHALVETAPHQLTLNVGKEDWPLPIPLVHANGKWYWDGAAGKEEIVYRRIRHNELAAINICKGVVSAQRDYASVGHDGQPAGAYAPRLVSDPGKQNGLYWDVQETENPSPASPLLAQATSLPRRSTRG